MRQIRTADVRAPSNSAADLAFGVGAYLTDGVFLYRLVEVLATEGGEMAEVEDCYGLDVVTVSVRALLERRLRVVTPARPPSPTHGRRRRPSSRRAG
jgi:hypothetical protein